MEIPLAAVLVGSLVVLGIGGYFFLMVFFPEWVGITGKDAMKTLEEHKGDAAAPSGEADDRAEK